MKPLLSILTPTIPERSNQVTALQEKLAAQDTGNQVEHLTLCDNKRRSIGAKRQALADIARGEYIAFVDDDDDISDDYVSSLLTAIKTGADVITFRQRAIYNGREAEMVFGLNNPDEDFTEGKVTLRAPWHVCAWKRDKVERCLFLDSSYGEDLAWCLQARRRVKTACHIDRVLHTYRHDAKTTAAPES
jgi:glycosyltransferase involved in cell wall biosynthesis